MTLHVESAGDGEPLVLVHGFTQSSTGGGRFGERLAARRRLLMVDAPGHGRSGHDTVDLWMAGDLLADVTDGADVLGYSMGGRIALHAAIRRPDRVGRLVLIGATAGLDGDTAREDRRRADHVLADGIERDGLPAFLDRWLSGPLFAGLDAEAAGREQRLANRPEGLAATLRHRGTGDQEPLWPRLGEITVPSLVIAGEHDDRFRAVGERLVTGLGGPAELHVVAGAGHAAHLERPHEVAHTVAEWLDRPVASGSLSRTGGSPR